MSGLAVWGSTALTLKPLKQRSGVTPRTIVGKMVGYAPGGRSYRVLLERTKTVIVRRDVAFDQAAPTIIPRRLIGTSNTTEDRAPSYTQRDTDEYANTHTIIEWRQWSRWTQRASTRHPRRTGSHRRGHAANGRPCRRRGCVVGRRTGGAPVSYPYP